MRLINCIVSGLPDTIRFLLINNQCKVQFSGVNYLLLSTETTEYSWFSPMILTSYFNHNLHEKLLFESIQSGIFNFVYSYS